MSHEPTSNIKFAIVDSEIGSLYAAAFWNILQVGLAQMYKKWFVKNIEATQKVWSTDSKVW